MSACVCLGGAVRWGLVLDTAVVQTPSLGCHCPAQCGLQSDERGDSTAN